MVSLLATDVVDIMVVQECLETGHVTQHSLAWLAVGL